jgi:hypothetical protein
LRSPAAKEWELRQAYIAADLAAREAEAREAEHHRQSARSVKALSPANKMIGRLRNRESADDYARSYGTSYR